MPTYAPTELNAPQDIIAFTATAKCQVRFKVDTTPLQAGDILRVEVHHDMTGDRVCYGQEYYTENTIDPGIDFYTDVLNAGDTIWLNLSQTAGVPVSINCEMWFQYVE